MLLLRLALLTSIGLGLGGCQGDPGGDGPAGVPVTLKLHVGSGSSISGTPWTLVLNSVAADSRCPLGAFCIQQGEALLALELASPLADPLPQDNPHFTLGSRPITVEGLRFSQVSVTPVRRIGEPIDQSAYSVTLSISGTRGARP
ncbi:MAG: hypothetical protein ACREK8_01300 [Gemmatimonadales bacterium]